jgi:hypothetical protein
MAERLTVAGRELFERLERRPSSPVPRAAPFERSMMPCPADAPLSSPMVSLPRGGNRARSYRSPAPHAPSGEHAIACAPTAVLEVLTFPLGAAAHRRLLAALSGQEAVAPPEAAVAGRLMPGPLSAEGLCDDFARSTSPPPRLIGTAAAADWTAYGG